MKEIYKISHYFNQPVEKVIGKDRQKEIMLPRQFCYKILKEELKISYPKIAMKLNKSTHATVISGRNTLNNLIETEKDIRKYYKHLLLIFDRPNKIAIKRKLNPKKEKQIGKSNKEKYLELSFLCMAILAVIIILGLILT